MEFTGDEKKIQALFSELSLEQQSHTPSFEKLWVSTEKRKPASFVGQSALATAMILAIACLIGTWSWYKSSQSENAVNIPPQISRPRTAEDD